MTPSESPPPYSPNDPYAPPSPERRTSPQLGDEETVRPLSLRGGDLRPMPATAAHPFLSPAAYFEERNFESDIVPSLMVLDVDIHPATKRDELPFPLSHADRELRDVTDQDWATFINYLLTELGSDEISGESEKGRRWGSMNPQEFFHAKAKMENIVNEWNEAFFMPRGLHFNAKFSFNPPATPTTSQADSETVVERSERSFPDTEDSESSRGAPFAEGPQGGPAGPQHPLQHLWMNWGRGRGSWPKHGGFGGRGQGFGPGAGPWQRNVQHPWPHHGHTPWEHHVQGPWEHRSHSFGRGRHRRNSSVSSASSSSSDSSVSSLSASDISDVDAEQVRSAIAAFRQDPTRKEHLKVAVRGLHNTLRAQRRGPRRCSGNNSQQSKAEQRKNREAIKAELRGLKEEVRRYRREKKQERSAKKRARKSERSAERRARKAERRAAETANEIGRGPGSSYSHTQAPSSSRGRDRHVGQERGVTGTDGPLTPPPDVLNRQDSSGQPYRLFDLSNSDRKLENAARQLETQADSLDHYARHWGQQAEHYAHIYVQHDINERHADERREAHFVRAIESHPQKANKLAESLAKQREKAQKHHEKRITKAEEVKQKILAQQQNVTEAAEQLRQQAVQMRAKMEYAGVRRDSASHSSRETTNDRDAAESSNYFERQGRAIGSWGERFGRDMEAWGNRFGRDMESWGERVGRDAEAWGMRVENRASK